MGNLQPQLYETFGFGNNVAWTRPESKHGFRKAGYRPETAKGIRKEINPLEGKRYDSLINSVNRNEGSSKSMYHTEHTHDSTSEQPKNNYDDI